jgi:hypothetical protein
MNRHTPLIVLSSLLGSLCIYCASGIAAKGGVASADTQSPGAGACCDSAPVFTKLAEGDLSVTATYNSSHNDNTYAQSPEVDVSAYRQVSVLVDDTGSCSAAMNRTLFRSDPLSAHWADGMPVTGVPISVIAPSMRVKVGANAVSSMSSCTQTFHYVVLGLK